MIWDDPDCEEKHDKGGAGVDGEDHREASQPEQHGVEAGVDCGADHGDGEHQAAAEGPDWEQEGEKQGRRCQGKTYLALPGNISLLMRCITGLMPKPWQKNIMLTMIRGEKPRAGLMARRSVRQWENAARAAEQRERIKEQEENIPFLLAFFRRKEEMQAVATLTEPIMTDAARGEKVRPESARTGAMNATRVAMPVNWQRKNKLEVTARERKKGLDLRMANLSKISGDLSQESISSSSGSQFQEVPRTQFRLVLAFSSCPCSANHWGDSGIKRTRRSRRRGWKRRSQDIRRQGRRAPSK